MEALLEHLTKIMAQHIGGYDRLAQLLLKEQAALIEHDLEKIQKISKAKETLALKIKLLLPAVSQAIQDVARALGLSEDPLPTMAELAAAAPDPWAGKTAAGRPPAGSTETKRDHAKSGQSRVCPGSP
jgi:hypothetical protein